MAFTAVPSIFFLRQGTSRVAHEKDGMANLQQLNQLRNLQQQISIRVVCEAKPEFPLGANHVET